MKREPRDSLGRSLNPHVERYRPMCKTDAQRREFDRLTAINKTAWPEKHQGKTVIGECRRYFETCDPKKIGHALYDFSIMGSGGFDDIAHYNINGFRAFYVHPLIYITELVVPSAKRWRSVAELSPDYVFHSFGVYTDGMHKGQVAHAIVDLAADNIERLKQHYMDRARARDEATLEELATKLGVTVQYPLRRAG